MTIRTGLALLTCVVAAWGTAAAQSLPEAVTETLWQLQRIQYMDDSVTVASDPARYTLRFGRDGRVQVQADCNRGAGGYETDGSSLRFLPIALTRALCPADSIDTEFARELANVVSFVLDGGTLALATAADTSILTFEAAPEK